MTKDYGWHDVNICQRCEEKYTTLEGIDKSFKFTARDIVSTPAFLGNLIASKGKFFTTRKATWEEQCPHCGAMHGVCPACKTRQYYMATQSGSTLKCDKCGASFTVTM
jgi:protein-arginine kinase activator protein McsA